VLAIHIVCSTTGKSYDEMMRNYELRRDKSCIAYLRQPPKDKDL